MPKLLCFKPVLIGLPWAFCFGKQSPHTQPGSLRKYTRGTLTQLSGNTRKSSVVPGFIYGHWNQFQ